MLTEVGRRLVPFRGASEEQFGRVLTMSAVTCHAVSMGLNRDTSSHRRCAWEMAAEPRIDWTSLLGLRQGRAPSFPEALRQISRLTRCRELSIFRIVPRYSYLVTCHNPTLDSNRFSEPLRYSAQRQQRDLAVHGLTRPPHRTVNICRKLESWGTTRLHANCSRRA